MSLFQQAGGGFYLNYHQHSLFSLSNYVGDELEVFYGRFRTAD